MVAPAAIKILLNPLVFKQFHSLLLGQRPNLHKRLQSALEATGDNSLGRFKLVGNKATTSRKTHKLRIFVPNSIQLYQLAGTQFGPDESLSDRG
jgi:hypothetical protein